MSSSIPDTSAILALEAILAFLRLGAPEQAEHYAEKALDELRTAAARTYEQEKERALMGKRLRDQRYRDGQRDKREAERAAAQGERDTLPPEAPNGQ